MYTYKHLLAVTNRKLCGDEKLLGQIERIASCHPAGVILREKDLSKEEYQRLAGEALGICQRYGTDCILHTWAKTAESLGCRQIHFSMEQLRKQAHSLSAFEKVGASVHSAAEAKEAEHLGATYLLAGHIFPTECKKGLLPRGLRL